MKKSLVKFLFSVFLGMVLVSSAQATNGVERDGVSLEGSEFNVSVQDFMKLALRTYCPGVNDNWVRDIEVTRTQTVEDWVDQGVLDLYHHLEFDVNYNSNDDDGDWVHIVLDDPMIDNPTQRGTWVTIQSSGGVCQDVTDQLIAL